VGKRATTPIERENTQNTIKNNVCGSSLPVVDMNGEKLLPTSQEGTQGMEKGVFEKRVMGD